MKDILMECDPPNALISGNKVCNSCYSAYIIHINDLSCSLFLGDCRSSRALAFSGSGFIPSEENNIPKNFTFFEP